MLLAAVVVAMVAVGGVGGTAFAPEVACGPDEDGRAQFAANGACTRTGDRLGAKAKSGELWTAEA